MTYRSLRLDRRTLTLLADRGEPLKITVHHQGHGRYTIRRKGIGETQTDGDPRHQRFTDALIQALFSYPQPVTVDGRRVHTRPFPGVAPVLQSKTLNRAPEHPEDWDLITSHGAITLPLTHNVLIGGVGQYWPGLAEKWRICYQTPAEGGNSHWQYVDTVAVQPVPVIETADLMNISAEEWSHAVKGWALPARTQQNAQDQISRALELEKLPQRAEGRIFRRAAGDLEQMNQRTRLIAVTGNPLTPPSAPGREPELVSLLEGMYRTGPDVPVWPAETPPAHPGAEIASFRIDPGPCRKQHPSESLVQETDRITGWYRTSDGATEKLDIPFHATGDTEEPEILLARWAKNDPDLATSVAAAYCGGAPPAENHGEIKAANTARWIEAAVSQVTLGRSEAHRRELQQLANSFQPGSTAPTDPITVTTGAGRITVTSRPNPDCDGCGRPLSLCDYGGKVCQLHGDHACIECRHSPPEHLT